MMYNRLRVTIPLVLIFTLVFAGCEESSRATPSVLTVAPSATLSFTTTPIPTAASSATLPFTATPVFTLTPSRTSTPKPPTSTPFPSTQANPLGSWGSLPTQGLPGPAVRDIAFATQDVAFIVAMGNVYRSTDGGATWTEAFNQYRWVQSLVVSPAFAADQTVFAVDGGGRLFRSVDRGTTWEEIARVAEIGGASDVIVWLSISPAYPDDPTLWACTEGGGTLRSTDGGLNWEEFDPGVELVSDVRLIPNPDYPANPALEFSDSPAIKLASVPADLPGQAFALDALGATMLLGTPHGLYRSTDGGATWGEANAGLPSDSIYTAAVAPDGTLYATLGDIRLFRLHAGGTHWESLNSLPGNEDGSNSVWHIAATADTPPVLFVATDDGLFISRDGGISWDSITNPIPASFRDSRNPLPILSADFARNGIAYLFTTRLHNVYQTRDGGNTWTEVALIPRVNSLIETPDGRWLAFAPRFIYEWDPETSAEWIRYPVEFNGEWIEITFYTDQEAVAIDGSNVFRSEDGGRSWTKIGKVSLDGYKYLVSPRFDIDHAIYAQDSVSPYVSTDAGATWILANDGLPACDYDGPDCGFDLLRAARTDGGYAVYALVRHDFSSRIWIAQTPSE